MSKALWDERKRMHVKTLVKKALDLSGDWDYMLYIDADTLIPPHYCEVIIKAMKENPRLVLGGARYLITPGAVQVSQPSHIRGTGYIMKRSIYDLFLAHGYDFLNPFGEVVLERFAQAKGFEVKSFPELHVHHMRFVHGSSPSMQGASGYVISTPLLAVLGDFVRNPCRSTWWILYGWLWAWKHRLKRYFKQLEHKQLMVWYIKSWLRKRWLAV